MTSCSAQAHARTRQWYLWRVTPNLAEHTAHAFTAFRSSQFPVSLARLLLCADNMVAARRYSLLRVCARGAARVSGSLSLEASPSDPARRCRRHP